MTHIVLKKIATFWAVFFAIWLFVPKGSSGSDLIVALVASAFAAIAR